MLTEPVRYSSGTILFELSPSSCRVSKAYVNKRVRLDSRTLEQRAALPGRVAVCTQASPESEGGLWTKGQLPDSLFAESSVGATARNLSSDPGCRRLG